MNTQQQKKLSLRLLEWHGGQSSGLYAVGSCMLSASEQGRTYDPNNCKGHDWALPKAIRELRTMKAKANFPECVTAKDERDCNRIADTLEKSFATALATPSPVS